MRVTRCINIDPSLLDLVCTRQRQPKRCQTTHGYCVIEIAWIRVAAFTQLRCHRLRQHRSRHNTQTEMLDHRFEVAIVMKQDMAVHDAVSADDQVDGLAHADAALPHQTKIRRSLHGQTRAEHRLDAELTQILLDHGGMALVARALQHLEKDEIADDDVLRIIDRAQRADRSAVGVAKMPDPDRAIDDDHLQADPCGPRA